MLEFLLSRDSEALLGNPRYYYPNEDRPLHTLAGSAAARGDTETLDDLYKIDSESLNARNKKGETPMHEAMAAGNLKGVEYIFNKKKDAFRDLDEEGHLPAKKALYGKHFVKSTQESRNRVLEFNGQKDPESFLIQEHEPHGETLLHRAAISSQTLEAIDIISNAKPQTLVTLNRPLTESESENESATGGITPALWAIRHGYIEQCERILRQMVQKKEILNPENNANYFNQLFLVEDAKNPLGDTILDNLHERANREEWYFDLSLEEIAAKNNTKNEQCLRIKALLLELNVQIGDKLDVKYCKEPDSATPAIATSSQL